MLAIGVEKEYKMNTIKVEMSIPWKAPNPLYDILYNQISIALRAHMLWTDTLINIITHRRRNHGGSGGWCPPMFSNNYIARLNFIHTDHTALAYRSIEPPFTKPSSYTSVTYSISVC